MQETVLGEHDGSLGNLSCSRRGNARGLRESLIMNGGSGVHACKVGELFKLLERGLGVL